MEILILRHAQADHLLENWHTKITYSCFIQKLNTWQEAPLTAYGRQQASYLAEKTDGQFDCILSSPLPRAVETAQLMNLSNRRLVFEENLSEIHMIPPRICRHFKLSINKWIFICVIMSFFNGEAFRIYRQARDLYDEFMSIDCKKLLVVSHSARIHSLIYYARMNACYRVISANIRPCGISVVRFLMEPCFKKTTEQAVKTN